MPQRMTYTKQKKTRGKNFLGEFFVFGNKKKLNSENKIITALIKPIVVFSYFQRIFLRGRGLPQMLRNFRGEVRDFVTTHFKGGGAVKKSPKKCDYLT